MKKICSKCSTEKPLTEYHVDRARKDGRTSSCKECRTKQTLQYHKENQTWKRPSYIRANKKRMATVEAKEKASHASTKWFYANHKKTVPYNRANAAMRRIRKRYPSAIECSLEDVLPVYQKAYEMELETGIHYQIDHIKPLQAGGKHVLSNLNILTEAEHKIKTLQEYKLIEQLLTDYYERLNNI